MEIRGERLKDRNTVEPPPEEEGITHGREVDASNTGILGAGIDAGDLITTGATTYSTPGQVVTGRNFTSTVVLAAAGITLRGCKITVGGQDTFGLRINAANCIVEDCTITSNTGFYVGIHVGSSGAIIRRCDVSEGENIITVEGQTATIEECYLHDVNILSDPAGHADVIEVYAGNNVTIRKNRLFMWTASAATVNIAPWSGSTSVDGTTIDDNHIDGGQAHIIVDLQSTGQIRNTRVRRNDFCGHTSIVDYNALQDNDGRGKVTTELALAADTTKILWPTSGADANHWADTTPLSPNRDGQIVT